METAMNVLAAQTDWAILVLRLALGIIFMAHGWNKIRKFQGTVEWFRKWNFEPANAWAVLAMLTQFVGGLCILLGIFVQAASVILAIEMMIAVRFNFKRKKPFFEVIELDIILLASLLLLATLGNGFWAISSLF